MKMEINGFTETTKKRRKLYSSSHYVIKCEETWQLALQLWHVVCLEDHRFFVKCHTNLEKLVDLCVLHHSIFH